MAQYNWSNLKIEFDVSDGGALQDISASLLTFNGVEINASTEDVTPASVSWEAFVYTGIKSMKPITLGLIYDDTATTGMNAVFNSLGSTRTLKVTYGSTKTTSVETIITNYKRLPKKGDITKIEVDLLPTGTVTEA